MNSAEIVNANHLINLEISNTSAIEACNVENNAPVWIPTGTTFSTTSVIWLNSDSTGIPPAGWYSDGVSSRQWDGINILGSPNVCINYLEETLGTGVSQGDACGLGASQTMYYPFGETFETTSLLWKDTINTLADAGWYSDGTLTKSWSGTAFTGEVFGCNLVLLDKGSIDDDACQGANGTESFMLLFGETFETATKLYTASGAFAPTGWYAVVGGNPGVTVRSWNFTTESFVSTSICT